MAAAEVMTTALVAAELLGGNQHKARCLLKEQEYIPHMLRHDSTEGSTQLPLCFRPFLNPLPPIVK